MSIRHLDTAGTRSASGPIAVAAALPHPHTFTPTPPRAAGNSYQGSSHAAVVIQRGRWIEDKEHMLVSGHQGELQCLCLSVSACWVDLSLVWCQVCPQWGLLPVPELQLPWLAGWLAGRLLLKTSPHTATVALPAGCVVSIGFGPRLFHLPKKGGVAGEVEESLTSVFALGSQDKRISGEQGCHAVQLPGLLPPLRGGGGFGCMEVRFRGASNFCL
jgi:hypothetical protein